MNLLARTLRLLPKARFWILGLVTIKDIPTDRFNSLIEHFTRSGWRKTYEYAGVDAWIDYGRVHLLKDRVRLTLEWDNWTEGSIEGPRAIVEGLAREFGLPVIHKWRWADYD